MSSAISEGTDSELEGAADDVRVLVKNGQSMHAFHLRLELDLVELLAEIAHFHICNNICITGLQSNKKDKDLQVGFSLFASV